LFPDIVIGAFVIVLVLDPSYALNAIAGCCENKKGTSLAAVTRIIVTMIIPTIDILSFMMSL
jgi:hypothetical protein